jgi:hypothetical protein
MMQNPSRQKRGGSLRALLPLFDGSSIIALQRKGAIMLYARCAYCGYTAPLTCSGQFMPHPTALVSMTGMGPTCPACGPRAPISTCPFMHTQYLYVPGASPMPQPGAGSVYAPVVQAQPGASEHTLSKAFGEVIGKVATEIGRGAAQAIFGQS